MNKYILITICTFLFSCNGSDKSDNEELNWLKNGTLHRASVAEWKNASDENKLATSADFAAKFKELENQKYLKISDLKNDAIDIKNCIDVAVSGGEYTDHMKVSEISVMCHMTMNNYY